MKALTVWQPWASLIMAGAKPFEFRGWRFPRSLLGCRIVIHAAARKIDKGEVDHLIAVLRAGGQDAAETCLYADKALPVLLEAQKQTFNCSLPFGAGLGTAVLEEPVLGTEVAELFGVPRANDSDRDQHANWGWRLTDIEVWSEPIAFRGAQGFWNWPTPADAQL